MVERGLGILCESPRMKLSQSSTWGSVVYFLFSAIYEIQHQFWWEGEVMNLSKLLQNIYLHEREASKPKCDIQRPFLAIVGILIYPLHLFISCCLCSCSSCFSSHPCSCSYFYFSSHSFCSSNLCSLTSCLCCGISSCPSSSWSGWERRTWSVLKVKQDLSSFEITPAARLSSPPPLHVLVIIITLTFWRVVVSAFPESPNSNVVH